MWTTVSLLAALTLTPAQAPELALTNVRATYDVLGPTRPDNKLLRGDFFFVAFDIENIKENENSEVLYSMGMEVSDSKGRVLYKQDPEQKRALNSLGGHRLPGFAHIESGFDQEPGEYTLKVTVTDTTAKTSKTLERKFELLPPNFGIIRLKVTSDPEAQRPTPAVGVPGQLCFINFVLVGFQRGPKGQPNLTVEMQVQDDKGKDVLPKPFKGDSTSNVDKDAVGIPFQQLLVLNRPGKFTLKVKATDQVNKKTAEVSFPVVVLESK